MPLLTYWFGLQDSSNLAAKLDDIYELLSADTRQKTAEAVVIEEIQVGYAMNPCLV